MLQGTLRAADGESLYYRYYWELGEGPLLVCFHGLGCHGGWLGPLADRISRRGVEVFVADQRGCGRSTGARGHISHRNLWLRDAEAIVAEARQHAQGPLFLEGSSAGAIVALRYALEHPEDVRGLVLLSPAFASKAGVVPFGTQLSIAWNSLFRPAREYGYPARYVDGGLTTGHPESLERIRADAAFVRTATARYTMELFRLTRQVYRRAGAIRAPTLVMQGGRDLVAEEKAALRFFERLGAADKVWRRYDDAYHGLELEPPARLAEIAEEIARFVRERAGAG